MLIEIEKWQIKAIYALGSSLGIVESNKADNLHEMVYSLTNKSSVKELTKDEADLIISKLRYQMQYKQYMHHKIAETPGMISKGQEKKIWALIYELREYDGPASQRVPVGKRLTGFLQKYAGVSDLRFCTYSNANKVIEGLKGIVGTVKRKAGGAGCQ